MWNSLPQNTRVVWLIAESSGSRLSGKMPWKPCTLGNWVILSHSIVSRRTRRSEEHTSELQSLMRISYAVFCLKKKKKIVYNKTSNRSYCTHNNIKILKKIKTI